MNINATVYKNVLESVLNPWIDKNYAHAFYMKQDSVPGQKAVIKKSVFEKKIAHFQVCLTSLCNMKDLKATIMKTWAKRSDYFTMCSCSTFYPITEAMVAPEV